MKTTNHILKFYGKCLLLSTPLLASLVFYICQDPFMVVRSYNDYDHCRVLQSEGAVSWEKYKLYRRKCHYDAFIMGTSCTKAFSCHEWNKYIDAHPFRMFCNAEGLGSLEAKLKALDTVPGQRINHLLVVAERNMFEKTQTTHDFIHVLPPDVSGESMANYQALYFQTFLQPKFLIPYLEYLTTGHISKKGQQVINANLPTREKYTNDEVIYKEQEIASEGERYWTKMDMAAKSKLHNPHEAPAAIASPQKAALKEIERICQKHHTDIQWVIGPNFDKERINRNDVLALQQIFGTDHVHDYSADETFYDYHWFYEPAHYRRAVGKKILHDIYTTPRRP